MVRRPQAPAHLDRQHHHPGLWAVLGELVVRIACGTRPRSIHRRVGSGLVGGGILVDRAGNPVEGVKIHPSIEFKKRPGDRRQLGVGRNLKTDAAGHWRFDSVPASKPDVFVEIDHPDYQAVRRPLTRA